MSADDDPVKAVLGDREDLYDVASWDVRTWLDGVAVRVWAGLRDVRRWFLLSLALGLFAAELAFVTALIWDRPTLGVLSVLSILPAAGLAAYFWYGDPTFREPLDTLAITFVLAVVFASLASVVNTVFFAGLEAASAVPVVALVGPAALFFLVVGPIEETVKWLAVRTYAYRRSEFDAVVDGVVYGAVAGLGFATIENLVYIVQGFLGPPPAGVATQVQGAVETAAGRAFVGPGHVIYSAFAGYYLGLAKFNPDRRGPIVVKGLLIAAFIHGVYNTAVAYLQLSGVGFVAFVVVFDGVLVAILYRKLARYRRFYRRALAVRGRSPPPSASDADE
jgi:RsiW-degrading membrane proteinase PrsW (M82 family)